MSLYRFALLNAFALVAAVANAVPAGAADECLAKPNKSVSSGEHWYYRYDGVNKRRCWYLRQETGRQSKGSTDDASLVTPNAPSSQKPADLPVASPTPPDAAGPAPVRETTGMPASSFASASADEQPDPSRNSAPPRRPDATADSSVSPLPANVAATAPVTAPTAAPPQSITGFPREFGRAVPPSMKADSPTAAPPSADLARRLVGLALTALAFLLIARPVSQLLGRRIDRRASSDLIQSARLSDHDSSPESIREVLGRCGGTAGSQDVPRSDMPPWPQDIARALRELAGATEAYRNGVTEKVRTLAPDRLALDHVAEFRQRI